MPAHPPHDPGSVAPETGASEAPARSLSEILEELAQISHAQQGEASAMRGAVSELSRALARLFEMIRADRAAQHTRIAELEEGLAQAEARIRELEAGAPAAVEEAPGAADFDALRGAAERLRLRTAELVREAGTPADAFDAETEAEVAEQAEAVAARVAEEARVEAARLAVEASLAEDEAQAARRAAEDAASATSTQLPITPSHDEPFDKPGILRVFPGAVLPAHLPDDLDVESELVFDELQAREAVGEHAVPTLSPPTPDHFAHNGNGSADGAAAVDDHPTLPPPTVVSRPQPVAVQPRIARKRRGVLRRRRIDARKLTGVEPAAALRAMVSSVDQLWTAGTPVDVVVALTDGGTLRIAGGDREPLVVTEVEPGTSARSTVTATSAQLVPLFGRLDLTDEQSAPLIHGSRRDADLLVGWIDRAQRLTAEPL